jgi:hypothetical protein
MRIVNKDNEEIDESKVDYSKGYLRSDFISHEDGTWEDVLRYFEIPQEELDKIAKEKEIPSPEERIKAMEDALMSMMLGGGSNV